MATIQNYRVPVCVDQTEHSAVFYETDNGMFDLRYGWARYTSGMHSTLDSAKEDFLRHLKREHPSKTFTLGAAVAIAEDEARRLSPTYEPSREES